MEHAPYFRDPRKTDAANEAIRKRWDISNEVRIRIDIRATALRISIVTRVDGNGKPARSVPRQTWAHRLIPHKAGGITQAEARAAVVDDHQVHALPHRTSDTTVGEVVHEDFGGPRSRSVGAHVVDAVGIQLFAGTVHQRSTLAGRC